ncbi:hypothetical protein HGA88_06030 [Candidatus Roizmanbacteria bacterium]|nr:hypothetical protein [Candidatus Roizmanbacteria bacterium]
MLALLYARRPDIKKTLEELYSYTPEKFTSFLTGSASELLTQLPEEYSLIPMLQSRDNGMFIDVEIVPAEAEKEYYALGDRALAYDKYIEQVSKGVPTPGAGYTQFSIKREIIEDVMLDFVYGLHMSVESEAVTRKPDYPIPGLKNVSNRNRVASPLLRSEGGKFSVSDAFIHMQEALIKSIARDSNSLALSSTSFLTENGKRMRLRNNYAPDYLSFIPEEYKGAFMKTNHYSFLSQQSDALLKVIHTPTPKQLS